MKFSRKIALCFAAALVTVMLMSFHCTASESIGTPITLNINGTLVAGAAISGNGIAYAPFPSLICALDPDAAVSVTGDVATATGNRMHLTARSGQNYIDANGRILYLDGAARTVNGTLYAAIRPVCTAYSLSCAWDSGTRTVSVTGIGCPIAPASEFYNEDDLYWLSHIISAESRGESLAGQIAVGNVIINRTRSSSFPNTIYDVIFDRKYGVQFSPTVSGTIYNTPTDKAVLAAKIVLEGADLVDDAIYFCSAKASSSSWIVRTRDLVETIGNHSFYA